MGFDTMTYALLKKKIVELEKSLTDKGFKCKLVDQLPEVGELNIVYLIKLQSEEKDNYYEEYVYLDGKWEKLGATQIDLTNVATKEELENLAAQQFSGSWNDLTDRPFYEKISDEAQLVYEGQVYDHGWDEETYEELNNFSDIGFAACFEPNTVSYITFIDKTYICEPEYGEESSSLVDKNENFKIYFYEGTRFYVNGERFEFESDKTYYLKVETRTVEELKTLDEKFIPETIAREEIVPRKYGDLYGSIPSYAFPDGYGYQDYKTESINLDSSLEEIAGDDKCFKITNSEFNLKRNTEYELSFYNDNHWYSYIEKSDEFEDYLDIRSEPQGVAGDRQLLARIIKGSALQDWGWEGDFLEPDAWYVLFYSDELINSLPLTLYLDYEYVYYYIPFNPEYIPREAGGRLAVPWENIENKPFGVKSVVLDDIAEEFDEVNFDEEYDEDYGDYLKFHNVSVGVYKIDWEDEIYNWDTGETSYENHSAILERTQDALGNYHNKMYKVSSPEESYVGVYCQESEESELFRFFSYHYVEGIGSFYSRNFRIWNCNYHEEFSQLDEKYIPDTIARKSDLENISAQASWNDLTDKPFSTVEVPVVNGEFTFDLPGVTMEQECIVTYSGDNKYNGWEHTLLDLMSGDYRVHKYDTNPTVEVEVTDAGIHCLGSMENDSTGTITVVVTLDDKYISGNIARTSQLPSKTSDLENDSNYISKAELQNILNQIKLNVAEDGTISISIPTIS